MQIQNIIMESYFYETRYALLYDIYYFFKNLSFDDIFIAVLEMSFAAAVIIPFILLTRIAFSKLPKKYSYFLWSAVFLKLIFPLSFNFPLSFGRNINIEGYSLSKKGVNFTTSANAVLNTIKNTSESSLGIQYLEGTKRSYISTDWEVWIHFGKYVWLFGMIIMLLFGIISAIKLKRKLAASVHLKENIYICDYIDTALVKGLLHPRIYVNSKVSETELRYILFHEKFHQTRHDHFFKLLAFLLLSVNWFNPLVWLFFIYFSEDMELSCDEAVLSYFGESERLKYNETILNLSLKKTRNIGTALYFGEGSLKKRLKNSVNYCKPTKIITVLSVFATLVLFFLFLTTNSTITLGNYREDNDYGISFFTADKYGKGDRIINPSGSDVLILKTETRDEYNKIYALVMFNRYAFDGSEFTLIDEVYTPAVIECEKYYNEKDIERYKLLSYTVPEKGENFEREVCDLFPDDIEKEALNLKKYKQGLEYNCLKDAMNYVGYDLYEFSNNINFEECKFTKKLPPIEEGEIKWVACHSSHCTIAIDNISSSYIDNYLENLKAEGYLNITLHNSNLIEIASVNSIIYVYLGDNCAKLSIYN